MVNRHLDMLVWEFIEPLTVSFKLNCVQLFYSNSVFVKSSSDGGQANAFHILEYQVVLYNSVLNFITLSAMTHLTIARLGLH